MMRKEAEIVPITRARKRGKKDDPLKALKSAAEMAGDAILSAFMDADQFTRHTYAEKTTGALTETVLETRNVKQLREMIGAIKDLTEITRSLHGILTHQEQCAMDAQLAKLRGAAGDEAETGVVLLPRAEDERECEK